MKLRRLDDNPLLTPADLKPTRDDLEVYCTLNPGAIRFGDEILLLVRVGERAAPDDETVANLSFDMATGEVLVRRYRRDDPDMDSRDSRAFGPIHRGQIRGKVWFRYWTPRTRKGHTS